MSVTRWLATAIRLPLLLSDELSDSRPHFASIGVVRLSLTSFICLKSPACTCLAVDRRTRHVSLRPLAKDRSMASDLRLKEQLPQLTNRVVQTYSEIGKINHLGHCPLPNYDVIISAIEDLREIIYPGYRRREGLHLGNITYHVGDLIDGLHDKLTTQIARALRHEERVRTGHRSLRRAGGS